jgi:hypothetical protein
MRRYAFQRLQALEILSPKWSDNELPGDDNIIV